MSNNPTDIQHILTKYGLLPENRLSAGMEAEVFTFGSEQVLKIYMDADLEKLKTLQDLYERLDRSTLPYALPRILEIAPQGEAVVTIEDRLPGIPMSDILQEAGPGDFDRLMRIYLQAAQALMAVPVPAGYDRCKLFDSLGISRHSMGDWNSFLDRWIAAKVTAAPT